MKASMLCGIIAGVVLLYVLSYGPALAVSERTARRALLAQTAETQAEEVDRFGRQVRITDAIYAPVQWMMMRSEAARKGIGWYCHRWEPSRARLVMLLLQNERRITKPKWDKIANGPRARNAD